MISPPIAGVMLLVAAPVHAEIIRIEVKSRADVLAGKAFAAVGPYEKLSGTIYFAIDPQNSANLIIADVASSNGFIHAIDAVLVPPSILADLGL